MDDAAVSSDVANRDFVRRGFEVAEAVDLFGERAALRFGDLEVVEVGSSGSGADEGGGVAFELEVLEVVVVACEVEVDVVLAEQRLPLGDEDLVVAVRAV